MKYCSKCGKEVNDDAVICVNCGCALNSSGKSLSADKKLNVCALVGFILSLASLFIALVGVTAITSIVFSGIGIKQINSSSNQKGKGFAIAGLVIGICSLIYTIIVVFIIGMLLATLA